MRGLLVSEGEAYLKLIWELVSDVSEDWGGWEFRGVLGTERL